ncbi:unnamed protein product [Moneuplotes crassus]|uniref:B-related factor 1 n=1 Tax=Euplotes crassus TaxID=5936 RepID=A0AAD1UEU3_EUPCR|nr:unnamed protein product [Moneuplotes crassus]
MKCPKCQSSNITTDEEQGEAVCECGNVIERGGIVNNVEFNNVGNRSKVYGSFFDKNAPNNGMFAGNNNLLSESGQMRLYKAYKLIEQIGSKLSLPQTLAESAKKLYKIAKLEFDKNFVQGRQTKHVAAVVLYIVCRLEQKPHLLIDFADALQTSLYSLGSTYLKLIKKIKNNMNKLDLPLIDPSLFIHKFCARLDFEDKTQTVATTALRMLQSMKRDWISTGRRPAGLCGAAILISARYHGFSRSTHQIVKVVKVCHETIRKRLQEFKKTGVAQLTMQEFEAIKDSDMAENDKYGMDPPAFIKSLLQKNKALKCIKDVECEEVKEEETEATIKRKREAKEESKEEEELEYQTPVIKEEIKPKPKKERPADLPDNESLLSSDDEDIHQYLLNEDEKKVKSVVWHKMNEEWLKEQEMNQKKAKKVENTPTKPSVEKKVKPRAKPNHLFAETLKTKNLI